MDLCPATLGCALRPRTNQKPTTPRRIIAAAPEAIAHVNLRAGATTFGSLIGTATAAARDEDAAPALAEPDADSRDTTGTTCAGGGGSTSNAALFPDSVSRFNR